MESKRQSAYYVLMWKMTLKQRRQHGELVARLDVLKKSPYSSVPAGYSFGEDTEEDKKYEDALASLAAVLEEMHDLDQKVSEQG
ncbi:MAG: hypothetical protein P8R02_16225 [Pseudomonadales bacterium]|jgi:hypothetical protein|nr:hypothetical protein [Pseudomonadales bacterium]